MILAEGEPGGPIREHKVNLLEAILCAESVIIRRDSKLLEGILNHIPFVADLWVEEIYQGEESKLERIVSDESGDLP